MSNGKKWKDGTKVHRDHSRRWIYHVMGGKHKKFKWYFRAKMKNGKYGDTDDVNHLGMRRPCAVEIWGWD